MKPELKKKKKSYHTSVSMFKSQLGKVNDYQHLYWFQNVDFS